MSSSNDPHTQLVTRAQQYAERNKIEDPIITVNYPQKTVSIVGESDGARISTDISVFSNGDYVNTSSKFSKKQRKSDYADEVFRLREMGFKQTEIAKKLGISQSMVSKLCRACK